MNTTVPTGLPPAENQDLKRHRQERGMHQNQISACLPVYDCAKPQTRSSPCSSRCQYVASVSGNSHAFVSGKVTLVFEAYLVLADLPQCN